MPLIVRNGKLLRVGGSLSTNASCCCGVTGACCNGGFCNEGATAETCDCEGCNYLGDGTTCDGVDCTQGACCTDGECSIATEEDCIAGDGLYNGDGTTCDGVDCAGTGACCYPNQTCADDMDEATCTDGGGAFRPSAACSDDPSPCSCWLQGPFSSITFSAIEYCTCVNRFDLFSIYLQDCTGGANCVPLLGNAYGLNNPTTNYWEHSFLQGFNDVPTEICEDFDTLDCSGEFIDCGPDNRLFISVSCNDGSDPSYDDQPIGWMIYAHGVHAIFFAAGISNEDLTGTIGNQAVCGMALPLAPSASTAAFNGTAVLS